MWTRRLRLNHTGNVSCGVRRRRMKRVTVESRHQERTRIISSINSRTAMSLLPASARPSTSSSAAQCSSERIQEAIIQTLTGKPSATKSLSNLLEKPQHEVKISEADENEQNLKVIIEVINHSLDCISEGENPPKVQESVASKNKNTKNKNGTSGNVKKTMQQVTLREKSIDNKNNITLTEEGRPASLDRNNEEESFANDRKPNVEDLVTLQDNPPSSREYRWSNLETVKFYRALAMIGADFAILKSLFPNKTQGEIKLKLLHEKIASAELFGEISPGGVEWNMFRLLDENSEKHQGDQNKQNVEVERPVTKTTGVFREKRGKAAPGPSNAPKVTLKNNEDDAEAANKLVKQKQVEASVKPSQKSDSPSVVTRSQTSLGLRTKPSTSTKRPKPMNQNETTTQQAIKAMPSQEKLSANGKNTSNPFADAYIRSLTIFTCTNSDNNIIAETYISRAGQMFAKPIPEILLKCSLDYLWNLEPLLPPPGTTPATQAPPDVLPPKRQRRACRCPCLNGN